MLTIPGEGRDLILLVALFLQQSHPHLLNIGEHVLLRQLRRAGIEFRIGLDGELIPGDMVGALVNGQLDITARLIQGLS